MLRDQLVTQDVGSTVRLRCRADAVPPPSVVWLKDGHLLMTSSPWTAAAGADDADDDDDDDDAGFILRLSSVTTEDAGVYTCRVFNEVGLINFTYTLQVTGLFITFTQSDIILGRSTCSYQLLNHSFFKF